MADQEAEGESKTELPKTELPAEEQTLRSAQRRDAHRTQTYRRFLHRLAQQGGFELQQAEAAAVAVLCALDQRLTPHESSHLEAQLPARLREMVWRCERHVGPRRWKPDRAGFLAAIAEELGLGTAEEAEPVVRRVFLVLREQIAEGESEDVASQLPQDLQELWAHPT